AVEPPHRHDPVAHALEQAVDRAASLRVEGRREAVLGLVEQQVQRARGTDRLAVDADLGEVLVDPAAGAALGAARDADAPGRDELARLAARAEPGAREVALERLGRGACAAPAATAAPAVAAAVLAARVVVATARRVAAAEAARGHR